ncbi:hypothetical protein JAO05_02765 [Burkholderia pseudomallei]|uniref:hypothetical protein n=1 Tax=Burkholderia pseudomallei TaxID=28450 RepID=UPI00016B1C10|nr:hypothetical protein [Burkholderia pseudomallei]MBH9654035.1 hypothetical protein [Burkholderia pseudomallei]MEB5484184.1 hypothetical protein [Burkholderia pseudomallei]MEB5491066.1 hypothetical protein [Burkholderia pseudomallei]MEB5497836.1 hypothetical protein [Burkholderia pseudomallei]MEB5503211.1 hypothetical protein [Burkholderia pseudomallei]
MFIWFVVAGVADCGGSGCVWRESTVPASESWELKMQMQLELLERPYLSAQELADVARDIGISTG